MVRRTGSGDTRLGRPAALERGVDQIARMVAELERRRMLAEIEALSVAPERDLIDADDFARRSFAP